MNTKKNKRELNLSEKLKLVSEHLKERLLPIPYYRERYKRDSEYFMTLAHSFPNMKIPKKKTDA